MVARFRVSALDLVNDSVNSGLCGPCLRISQQSVAGSNIVWCMCCAGGLIVGGGGPDENMYAEID